MLLMGSSGVDLSRGIYCGIATEFFRHYCEHMFELGVTILGRYEAALTAPEELNLKFGPESIL